MLEVWEASLIFANWLATAIAILGAIYNSNQEKKGFYLWILSNTFFCVHNFCIQQFAVSFLFCFYIFISVNGLLKWKDNDTDNLA